jgi:hypothetical protein
MSVDFGLPDECPLYLQVQRESGHCWTSRSGQDHLLFRITLLTFSPGQWWLQRRKTMGQSEFVPGARDRRPWNAGWKIGGKRALKPPQVGAMSSGSTASARLRDRAMFDVAIDSKLRGYDVVKVKIGDLAAYGRVRSRAVVVQQKAGRPVQFELLDPPAGASSLGLNIEAGPSMTSSFRVGSIMRITFSARQYARLVDEWVTGIGLRREDYGTHSLRRTKASII